MIGSQEQEQQNQNEQSFEDQNALQTLKQEVSLNNHQLLQLTYNDQKFYQKLKELNHQGCIHIQKMQFTHALVYLSEAQKVLQYAASCGKTIERKLIITTLNNEASLYQKAWQLQKAQSYLQAIIYNISSFFQNNSQYQQIDPTLQFTKNIIDPSSTEYQDFSISLWRKKSLVIFYLQYCAINSQNKNNERAFSSAQKAVSLIKQISMDFYKYEKYLRQSGHVSHDQQWPQNEVSSQSLLYQLATFKDIDMKQVDFETFYKSTVKHIAIYMKRLDKSNQTISEQRMEVYKNCFQNYSIGTIMQINPVQLDQQSDKLDLKYETSMIQKHFKAIYLSVGHFILGTEARFIAAQKYTLDENQRRSSPEFKQSQIYHLSSILILTRFLLCSSGYFDHIVNSFRNHYKQDIMQDAKNYLQNYPNLTHHDLIHTDDLFSEEKSSKQQSPEVQQIDNLQSQIKTVQQIPGENIINGPVFNINTESSEQIDDQHATPKQKSSGAIKSTKQSKNTVCTQNTAKEQNSAKDHNTATKKNQIKKTSNMVTKGQTRLHTQQANRMIGSTSQHQHKNMQKAIHLLTSREKQNKLKPTQVNQNDRASRSKRKSDYNFLSANKKIQIGHDKLTERSTEKHESKRQTIYYKRESDYIPNPINRNKNKRIPTSNEAEKKAIRRKDSCGDLRKTKKIEDQYGISSNTKHIQTNKIEIKTSRNNLNINLNNNMKKSKQNKQSQQKLKLTSPQLKLKKLKSPRNIKK